MTTETSQAAYLAGVDEGNKLQAGERATLDRIRHQLASEAVWSAERSGIRSRLLEAAAMEPSPAPASLDEAPVIDLTTQRSRRRRHARSDRNASASGTSHRTGRRGARVGVAALAVAAAAALGFTTAGQLTSAADGPATVATYELAATPLDPDAVATAAVKPTVAGVEIELKLMGLDNAEGPDYYAAWLMSDTESIPLGSFHWRKGGVPIILWSGVDDPAYDRIVVTRQQQGDDGIRSDQVVLRGTVSDLTG